MNNLCWQQQATAENKTDKKWNKVFSLWRSIHRLLSNTQFLEIKANINLPSGVVVVGKPVVVGNVVLSGVVLIEAVGEVVVGTVVVVVETEGKRCINQQDVISITNVSII